MLKPHTIYENEGIDLREIKCSCDNPECKIGLSFDEDYDKIPRQFILRLHDKYGNEHGMRLSEQNINLLKQSLKFDNL